MTFLSKKAFIIAIFLAKLNTISTMELTGERFKTAQTRITTLLKHINPEIEPDLSGLREDIMNDTIRSAFYKLLLPLALATTYMQGMEDLSDALILAPESCGTEPSSINQISSQQLCSQDKQLSLLEHSEKLRLSLVSLKNLHSQTTPHRIWEKTVQSVTKTAFQSLIKINSYIPENSTLRVRHWLEIYNVLILKKPTAKQIESSLSHLKHFAKLSCYSNNQIPEDSIIRKKELIALGELCPELKNSDGAIKYLLQKNIADELRIYILQLMWWKEVSNSKTNTFSKNTDKARKIVKALHSIALAKSYYKSIALLPIINHNAKESPIPHFLNEMHNQEKLIQLAASESGDFDFAQLLNQLIGVQKLSLLMPSIIQEAASIDPLTATLGKVRKTISRTKPIIKQPTNIDLNKRFTELQELLKPQQPTTTTTTTTVVEQPEQQRTPEQIRTSIVNRCEITHEKLDNLKNSVQRPTPVTPTTTTTTTTTTTKTTQLNSDSLLPEGWYKLSGSNLPGLPPLPRLTKPEEVLQQQINILIREIQFYQKQFHIYGTNFSERVTTFENVLNNIIALIESDNYGQAEIVGKQINTPGFLFILHELYARSESEQEKDKDYRPLKASLDEFSQRISNFLENDKHDFKKPTPEEYEQRTKITTLLFDDKQQFDSTLLTKLENDIHTYYWRPVADKNNKEKLFETLTKRINARINNLETLIKERGIQQPLQESVKKLSLRLNILENHVFGDTHLKLFGSKEKTGLTFYLLNRLFHYGTSFAEKTIRSNLCTQHHNESLQRDIDIINQKSFFTALAESFNWFFRLFSIL